MDNQNRYQLGHQAGERLKKFQPEIFQLLEKHLDVADEFQRGLKEGGMSYTKSIEQGRLNELNGNSGMTRENADKMIDRDR